LKISLKHLLLGKKRNQSPDAHGCSNENSLLSDIIQSCAESILPAHTNRVNLTPPEAGFCVSGALLIEEFTQQLNRCEDAALSCHILDLLSILFINTKCSRGILSALISGTLHSVYKRSDGEANLPYIFFKLNCILNEGPDTKDENARTSVVRESFASLVQTSKVLMGAKYSSTACFVHHLLAQWSALIMEDLSQRKFLTGMVESLDTFLLDSFQRSTQKNHISRPRTKTALSGLNEKTYTFLFELTLHMISTSLSLSTPIRVNRKRPANVYRAEKPYEEVIWPMKVYCKLLSIFQKNLMFFPRRFILITVKITSTLITLNNFQLQQCVQWRNSQPTQMGIGVDSAAVELLQPLIDCVASLCLGYIPSFCNSMKIVLNCDERGLGINYKHTKAITCLLFRCEGIKETLLSICQSHILTVPNDFTSTQETRDSPKRKRDYFEDDNGPEMVLRRKNREFSTPMKTRPCGSHTKTLKSPSVLELLSEPGIGDECVHYDSINCNSFSKIDSADSDESSQNSDIRIDDDEEFAQVLDDDDSFEVVGDWGT
jgi:hypothetical protein